MEEPQIKDANTFLTTLHVISPRLPKTLNIQNDSQREAFFQEIALKSFRLAREYVRKNTKRDLLPPPTYQGARVKSEEDIQRIQGLKDAEVEKKRKSEDAKKQRYLAKFAKQAQTEAKVRKETEKREDMKKLSEIKKTKDSKLKSQKLSALMDGGDDFDVGGDYDNDNNDVDENGKKPQGKRGGKKMDSRVSGKRAHKNDKFGFGGKKRGMKRNTQDSLNDDATFSVRKNKSPFAGGVKKRTSSKKGADKNRPGKQRRQQMRSKTASRKQKK